MKKKILLLGSGGHAKSCLDIILSLGLEVKILCEKKNVKKKIMNKIVSLDYSFLTEDKIKNFKILIGIGHIKNPNIRINLYKKLKILNANFLLLKSKTANISKFSSIKKGTFIGQNVIVNADAEIGYNCIINNKALIEHDVKIGNHVHISTGAIINGDVKIGSGSFIGSGSIIFNNITIGKNCVVGAGQILKKSIKDNTTVK